MTCLGHRFKFLCDLKLKKKTNSRYDYEECELEPCNAMMTAMETLITSSSFTGRSFSFGGKTYKVKIADNFSYNDPIDKSISTKQVWLKKQKKIISKIKK